MLRKLGKLGRIHEAKPVNQNVGLLGLTVKPVQPTMSQNLDAGRGERANVLSNSAMANAPHAIAAVLNPEMGKWFTHLVFTESRSLHQRPNDRHFARKFACHLPDLL